MSVSLVWTDDPGFTPHGLPHPAGGQQIRDFGYWFPRGTHDWVMSDNLVNQFRVGYNRQTQLQDQPSRFDEPGWPTQLGLRGMEMATAHFPRIAWSFTGTSTALGYNDRFATTYTASDGLLWTKGAHSFKFGGEIRRQETFKYLQNQANMNFSRNQTALPTAISTTGLDFASFLLGYVDSAGLSIYGPLRAQTTERGSLAFTRRTISRSTQRLTINYGLRLDILTPLTEANDYYSMVDTTKPNPAAGNLPGVYVFAGQDGVGSRIAPADKNSNNLGPRLGLAYALNDKTVLRAAYGISYFQTGAYGGGNNVNQNDAYWPTSTTSSPDDLTGAYTFTQGFPARDLVIPPLITPALGVGTGFVNYWHPTAARAGRSKNWSVGVQRALGRSMSIDVAYVASRGDHLPVRVDINQLDPKFLSLGPLLTRNIRDPQVVAAGYTPPYAGFNGSLAQALRPFPQFPNMFPGGRNSDTRGTSTYDALQVKFDKRYSQGVYATVAYTWADHLTNAPNNFVNNAPMHRNAYDLSMSQHRPPTYRPHVGAMGFLYELPVGTGKMFLNNDERAGEDYRWLAVEWNSPLHKRADAGSQRHASEPGVPRRRDGRGNRRQHRNSANGGYRCWSADDVGHQGFRSASGSLPERRGIRPAHGSVRHIDAHDRRVARVCLAERGPGLGEDDRMQGSSTLQIRVEMFNAFNRVEFGNPASNIGNPETFGRITSQANTPRNMQIALKVTF